MHCQEICFQHAAGAFQMVWLKLQLSRVIVADAPTAFDLGWQPGMPFQLLFGSAPCAQDNSLLIYPPDSIARTCTGWEVPVSEKKEKRYSKFSRLDVLHHLRALQLKIGLGPHPFWKPFLPSRAEATCISSLLHQEMCNLYFFGEN